MNRNGNSANFFSSIELRFSELMRMGHLLGDSGFQADFISMEALLDETLTRYCEVSLSYDFHAENKRQDIYGCY